MKRSLDFFQITLCLLVISNLLGGCVSNEPVYTEKAKYRGIHLDGVSSYLGIRYAEPPVGKLRWAPPEPVRSMKGVVDAVKLGPACVQPILPRDSMYAIDIESSSEDCLNLNIWAPEHARKAPVIVWIHGGSLTGRL